MTAAGEVMPVGVCLVAVAVFLVEVPVFLWRWLLPTRNSLWRTRRSVFLWWQSLLRMGKWV
jgi:hypothetical protein